MIYFDNAATGGFKPSAVVNSAEYALKYLSANPGRSGHRLAVIGEEFIFRTRSLFSEVFNNRRIERVIFTKNCTEALNMAIFSLAKPDSEVVTTVTEHNSVLRPLYELEAKKAVTLKFAVPSSDRITVKDVLPLISAKTSLVVINAVSNVTGKKNDYEEIALSVDCPVVIDGAQAGGHLDIDLKRDKISALALAGHKGLYGIPGSGVLVFDDSVEISPLIFGGTGTESFEKVPSCYPELLESGTLNLPAIASLYDGLSYAVSNMEQSKKRLTEKTAFIVSELKRIGVRVYSDKNPFGIVAFASERGSVETAEILSEKYDIAVRGGFHCAPLMHKFLGTASDGLVRVSLAVQNTDRETEKFIKAVRDLVRYS